MRQSGGVTGTISFNGKPFTRQLQKYMAYMHQEDIFIAELTPREHLLFHATLRMDNGISWDDRVAKVDELLGVTGLDKVFVSRLFV